MIYLVIVLLTNLVTLGIIKLLNYSKRIKMPKIVYRQSTIFIMMKDMIPKCRPTHLLILKLVM